MNELVAVTPMELISQELAKGTSVADLAKLFDMAERYEKAQMLKKWAESIRGFQEDCPVIVKRKGIPDKMGNIKYKYADYEEIMTIIQSVLTKWEIVPTFTFAWKDKLLETTCHIRVGTHVEDTMVPLGIPEIPGANETQKAGGATQYGMRYSLKAALNIRIVGEDNDAADLGDPNETLTASEVAALQDMIDEVSVMRGKGFNTPRFVAVFREGATKLTEIPRSEFAGAVSELNRWRKESEKGSK